MQLFCLRHGEAQPFPNEQGERPLTDEGRSHIHRLAHYLAQQDISFTRILHSKKTRATETAKLLASRLQQHTQDTEFCPFLDPDSYAMSALLSSIHDAQDATLLVSHMPFISQLMSLLITHHDQYNLVDFQPGTLACLERHHSQRWLLKWLIAPHMVPHKIHP